MSGTRLVYAQLILLLILCLMPNLVSGFSARSIHWAIVASINVAIPWFLLAFSARPLLDFWPNTLSHWAVKNRRYLGINWGISFFTHGIFIIVSALLYPESFFAKFDWGTAKGGSVVFLMSTLMLVTSNDWSVRCLGPRLWGILHTVGGYLILFALLLALVNLNIHKPWLWPSALLTVLLAVLRIVLVIKKISR